MQNQLHTTDKKHRKHGAGPGLFDQTLEPPETFQRNQHDAHECQERGDKSRPGGYPQREDRKEKIPSIAKRSILKKENLVTPATRASRR